MVIQVGLGIEQRDLGSNGGPATSHQGTLAESDHLYGWARASLLSGRKSAAGLSRGTLEKSRLPSPAGAPAPLEVGGLQVVPSAHRAPVVTFGKWACQHGVKKSS